MRSCFSVLRVETFLSSSTMNIHFHPYFTEWVDVFLFTLFRVSYAYFVNFSELSLQCTDFSRLTRNVRSTKPHKSISFPGLNQSSHHVCISNCLLTSIGYYAVLITFGSARARIQKETNLVNNIYQFTKVLRKIIHAIVY